MFEAMMEPGQQPKLNRDHVLLHCAAGISDADVEGLAASAALWDHLVHNAPDMLPHKVLASDLLGKAEVALVALLRPLMIQQHFAPSEHISQAVERYRYEEMPPDRRAALLMCLTTLCNTVGITMDELHEFEVLAQWAREGERNGCFCPLGNNAHQLNAAAAVAAARAAVTTNPEFQVVRASSLLLVRILDSWLPAPPPARTATREGVLAAGGEAPAPAP